MFSIVASLLLGLTPAVHPEREAQIATISAAGATWKAAAHQRFSSQAPGASKTLCGLQGDWKAQIQAKVGAGEIETFYSASNDAIPDTFDSETNWPQCAKIINDIRDRARASNWGDPWPPRPRRPHARE